MRPPKKRTVAFFIGLLVHTVAWAVVVWKYLSRGELACYEGSCYRLIVMDFPVSLLFVAGNSVGLGSLLLGGLFWGAIARGLAIRFGPYED